MDMRSTDYGYGIMGVPYDIGQMVDELIGMKEIAKEQKKAQAVYDSLELPRKITKLHRMIIRMQ